MSGGAGLERGYRRLLACFPRRFRDEQGEELLTVLLDGAGDGQHRPGLFESADLVRNGLGMRLRPDNSRSARQGWSDALAAYSLAAPVLHLRRQQAGPGTAAESLLPPLLLAATFYPTVFWAATLDLGGLQLIIELNGASLLALMFAGPLLCAAVALSTAIRPRRHRII